MKTLIEQLVEVKNETGYKKITASDIINLDTAAQLFQVGKSRFSYELTPGGKVQKGSIKFLSTYLNYENCSY